MLTSDRAYVCPCFYQRLAFARLSAHSRYRAPNRRRVLKRRRVLNRWRGLRLLGSSLSIHCTSLHNRIVFPARRYLRPRRLTMKWEHLVPTYMQRGPCPSSCQVVSLRTFYFRMKCIGSAVAQNLVFSIEIHWVLSGVHEHVPLTDNKWSHCPEPWKA